MQASVCQHHVVWHPEAAVGTTGFRVPASFIAGSRSSSSQSSVGVVLLGILMLAVTLFEILFRRHVWRPEARWRAKPQATLLQMCGASRLWLTLAAARADQLRTAIVKLQGSQSPPHRTVAPEMVVVIN